jgi:hypothetical protein
MTSLNARVEPARDIRHSPPSESRVFVQMPAYRDTELVSTLRDLFAKAADPDLLRVVVFWQKAPWESLPPSLHRHRNLEVIEVPYQTSRGCNWARSVLQKEWRGEPYTLMIDSHHRFVRNWDQSLRNIYGLLKSKGVARPAVTAYLPPYKPGGEVGSRKRMPYQIYPREREDGVMFRLTSYPIPYWKHRAEPIAADFLSLHFLFTDGSFNRDVPFDPDFYFMGDEVAISLRAFTHGFDLFHPNLVLGWHCYDRDSRITHWDDNPSWMEQHVDSMIRLKRLLTGRQRGRYGPGRVRSLRDYEDRIGFPLVDKAATL